MSTTERTDEIRPEQVNHDGSATDTPRDPVVQADLAPDEEELEVPRDLKATIRRLWDSAREQHWRLYVVGTALVFYVIITLAGPIYTAYLLDLLWEKVQAAWSGDAAFTITWMDGGIQIMGLLLLYTVQWVFYSTQTFVMASFAERLNLKLRNQVGVKLTKLPLKYYDAHQPGRIISRVTNDLDKTSEVLQTGLLRLLTAVGNVTGAVIMMFTINVWLTLIFLVFAIGSSFVTKVVAHKTLVLAAERQRSVGILTGHVEEAYSGRAIIRAFNQEDASSRRIHQATQDLADTTRRADFMTNAINPAIRLITRFSQVFIAVLGGFFLTTGTLTIGTFQAFFQYINQASEPLTELSFMINSLQSALASVERVFDILDEEEIEPRSGRAGACARTDPRTRGLRARQVRIRPGSSADEGRFVHGRTRAPHRHCRFDRRRQDHADQSAHAVLRDRRRPHPPRRRGYAPYGPYGPAPPFRHGAAGRLAVRRHHRREHRVRPTGRHPRADHRGRQDGTRRLLRAHPAQRL